VTELPDLGDVPGQTIVYMRLDDLVPAERNSKLHDIDSLTEAVTGLGFTTELKLDESSGRLIRGHGRLATLRRLRDKGAEAPEGVRDVGDDWAVPVVRGWSSRSRLHADAVREADNHQGEGVGYDSKVQLDILAGLSGDAPDLLRATGWTSERVDELLQSVGGGATVTNLDGLAGVFRPPPSIPSSDIPESAVAPWNRPDTEPDPFGRPVPPETGGDEQWDTGQTIVDPEPRQEPPGPLDVAPAIRTLQPWRFAFHAGGPDGARAVMDWLKGHSRDIRCEDGDVVLWHDQDGDWQLLPGRWVTRDGQTGAFDTWTDEEFHARFVPANEPARRAFKRAADSKVNARTGEE